ncbi:MAG: hypothetical protein WBA17_14595 [Saprospiraceae bacterium]
MPFLLLAVALFFPRIIILVLYFLTDWFSNSFDGIIIPLLGFIFLPVTLLWYAVVMTYFGGDWSTIPIVGMVVALVVDLGLVSTSRRGRR